ncbi:hypothetical protein BH18ACT8_BH18ACT8_05610 [soil metagenome]
MVDWRSKSSGRQPSESAAQRRLEVLTAHLAGIKATVEPPAAPLAKGRQEESTTTPALGLPPTRHVAAAPPVRRRVAAALEDRRMAVRELTGRGTISGHHVAVLAAVLAMCLAVTAWWVVAGRSSTEPIVTPTLAPAEPMGVTDSVPVASGGIEVPMPVESSAASPGALVIVDVAGKVRRPGIVTLPVGSRVVDALKAAGGARPTVDLTSLNLARQLVDGEQLLVGLVGVGVPPPGALVTTPTSGVPIAPVNLNTATAEQLDTLPGVGPVTAQAILDWRAAHGSFSSVDELLEVDGIGEATLADLRDLVTV